MGAFRCPSWAVLVLVAGVPHELEHYTEAMTLEAGQQSYRKDQWQAPEIIKESGNERRELFNANGAIRYENPSSLEQFY